MAEVSDESLHVASAKQRTVLLLSAMRHLAAALRADGLHVLYRAMSADGAASPDSSLANELTATLAACTVQGVRLVEPGENSGMYMR